MVAQPKYLTTIAAGRIVETAFVLLPYHQRPSVVWIQFVSLSAGTLGPNHKVTEPSAFDLMSGCRTEFRPSAEGRHKTGRSKHMIAHAHIKYHITTYVHKLPDFLRAKVNKNQDFA